MPESISNLSVLSSVHETRTRDGCRMMPPAPQALHWSPFALSASRDQFLAMSRPAAFRGTDSVSPTGAVRIRWRQSSLTCATHVPVKSVCAACRGVCGGGGGCAAQAVPSNGNSPKAVPSRRPIRMIHPPSCILATPCQRAALTGYGVPRRPHVGIQDTCSGIARFPKLYRKPRNSRPLSTRDREFIPSLNRCYFFLSLPRPAALSRTSLLNTSTSSSGAHTSSCRPDQPPAARSAFATRLFTFTSLTQGLV